MGGDEQSFDRLSSIRERTGIKGPSYARSSQELGVTAALCSAYRLLRADLVDAALVGGGRGCRWSLLLLERHGDSFVTLGPCAEMMGVMAVVDRSFDENTARRLIDVVWASNGRPPLGYVHISTNTDPERTRAQSRWLRSVVTDVPVGTTPFVIAEHEDSLDASMLASALVRGVMPQPGAHELEHDRVLVHACGNDGHQVALRIEVRG